MFDLEDLVSRPIKECETILNKEGLSYKIIFYDDTKTDMSGTPLAIRVRFVDNIVEIIASHFRLKVHE